MRKIGLLSVLLFSMFAVTFAQEEEQDWRQVFPRNEFSLGIGDPAFANLQRGSIWEKLLWCHFDRYQSDNLGNWFDPGIYHSNYIATCPISLGYMYRLRKFLWLGGSVSYMGVFGKVFDARDDSFLYNHTETQIALLPAVRFSYLNKKYVTLYSGLSTGFMLNFERERKHGCLFPSHIPVDRLRRVCRSEILRLHGGGPRLQGLHHGWYRIPFQRKKE